ncbi:glycosyltransferase, partial [candidate division WWE3 bacterium]|nr:glycosyltransferase [candidate division WWE3 bacterium]
MKNHTLNNRLRIAQVTGLHESVPPVNKSGLEQLVHYLIEGLIKRGHSVTLFGTGDSKTSAELVPVWPMATTRDPLGKILPDQTYTTWAVSEAYLQSERFDIIHNHTGWVSGHFAGLIDTPVVTTLHHPVPSPKGFFDQFPDEYLSYFKTFEDDHFKNNHLVAVSHSQTRHLVQPATVIHNGIPEEEWSTYSSKPGDYLAYLGYISGNKGVHEAILATLNTNETLKIAGGVDENDFRSIEYFNDKVKPYIDHEQIIYVGALDNNEKKEFLAGAKATLMPIQWDEPFGLVAIESMSCGTPVIALN